ncbi:MAG: hypothetical protein R3F55_02435 [Alphaproteobacteria bacterium]
MSPRTIARRGPRAAGLAAACALAAAPALAQQPADAVQCYAAALTPQQVADHHSSIVEMLMIVDTRDVYVEPGDGAMLHANVTLRTGLRDRFGLYYTTEAFCSWPADGARYDCYVACDAGYFGVTLNDDGSATLVNDGRGFGLYGPCDGAEDEADEVFIASDDAHFAYRLAALPAEACPADLWAMYDHPDQ